MSQESKARVVAAELKTLMETMLFQTSLIAAFVAGMVALFAPCCITFLLPAYLGSVFKEKEKVVLMTLVFGAGIFVVLLPAVLGVAFISQLIFRGHETIYLLGGLVMLLVAITTILGVKMPVPHLPNNQSGKSDVLSIFTLGIFSGITSACCAPVLIGILTLTFLSPSFFGALAVGVMYVLGMVVPLLLIALLIGDKVSKLSVLRQSIASFKLGGSSFNLILSNVIAGIVFLFTGLLTLGLTLTGRLSNNNMDSFTKIIQNAGNYVNSFVGGNILANVVFALAVVVFIYIVAKRV